MMTGSAKSMKLVILTTRGMLQVFKVKSQMCLDSCALEVQISVAELVKAQEVTVESIAMMVDQSLVVVLSNLQKFMYDTSAKTWRLMPSGVQLSNAEPNRPTIKTAQGTDLSMQNSPAPKTEKGFSLQCLISALEEPKLTAENL